MKKTISTLLVTCIMYNDNKFKPFNIMPAKTSAYVYYVCMCFLIEDNDLLEKYNTI